MFEVIKVRVNNPEELVFFGYTVAVCKCSNGQKVRYELTENLYNTMSIIERNGELNKIDFIDTNVGFGFGTNYNTKDISTDCMDKLVDQIKWHFEVKYDYVCDDLKIEKLSQKYL